MDVKFEGENVVRHLDLTTHNHASDPGDTPPMTYMDKMKSGDAEPCGNMPEKMKEACAGGDPCESGCKAARKCALAPHKPRSCCKNEQAHHVIPVRCFLKPGERKKTGPLRGKGPWKTWPGSEGYNPNEAPCICLEGHAKGQGTGSHKIAHDHFDAAEDAHISPDGTAGSWSYAEACKAGADSIEKATKGKGDCSAKCIRAQLNAYHSSKKKMPHLKKSTRLRADSKGTNTPQNFNPSDCTHGFDTAF